MRFLNLNKEVQILDRVIGEHGRGTVIEIWEPLGVLVEWDHAPISSTVEEIVNAVLEPIFNLKGDN